jgi:hypothetical protein
MLRHRFSTTVRCEWDCDACTGRRRLLQHVDGGNMPDRLGAEGLKYFIAGK